MSRHIHMSNLVGFQNVTRLLAKKEQLRLLLLMCLIRGPRDIFQPCRYPFRGSPPIGWGWGTSSFSGRHPVNEAEEATYITCQVDKCPV